MSVKKSLTRLVLPLAVLGSAAFSLTCASGQQVMEHRDAMADKLSQEIRNRLGQNNVVLFTKSRTILDYLSEKGFAVDPVSKFNLSKKNLFDERANYFIRAGIDEKEIPYFIVSRGIPSPNLIFHDGSPFGILDGEADQVGTYENGKYVLRNIKDYQKEYEKILNHAIGKIETLKIENEIIESQKQQAKEKSPYYKFLYERKW